MRRSMFAAVIALASGTSLFPQGAFAQGWNLPDGIDNPRPRYYDYHPPGVFYGDAGPVGFAASGFVVAPYAVSPAPAYGSAAYGYVAPYAASPAPAYGSAAYGYVAPYAARPAPAYGSAGYGYVAPYAARPAPAYGSAGYGYVAPYAANPAPAYGSAGYSFGAPYAAPSVAVPVAPRPLCGVYRYWQNGICIDRRGY